jgi:biotin transport system substrate-specific component
MATAATTPDRLVLADLVPGSLARDAALIVGGAGLTGLAAQVSIHTPLTPVPFTLQTFAVLLTGAVLGPVRGALSMLLYLVAGVVGELSRRGNDRQVLSTIGLMALGSAIVYVFGATWLAADLHVGAQKAVDLGVTPFLVTDALKLAAAGLVLPAAWRLVRRFR